MFAALRGDTTIHDFSMPTVANTCNAGRDAGCCKRLPATPACRRLTAPPPVLRKAQAAKRAASTGQTSIQASWHANLPSSLVAGRLNLTIASDWLDDATPARVLLFGPALTSCATIRGSAGRSPLLHVERLSQLGGAVVRHVLRVDRQLAQRAVTLDRLRQHVGCVVAERVGE